jgi:hypothetical protein
VERVVAGWNARMTGLVLCAFFGFGVITGFSEPGRAATLKAAIALRDFRDRVFDSLSPERATASRYTAIVWQWAARAGLCKPAHPAASGAENSAHDISDGAIALIERRDGFYSLFDGGELRGPVAAGKQPDLPILSGSAVENSSGVQMIDYATTLIRAESQLSELISEMRVGDDGTASMFLDRERTELIVDLDRASGEIQRALQVRRQFEGRENLIAMLDMTTPGQAVVRLHGAERAPSRRKGGLQVIAEKMPSTAAAKSRRSP